MKAVKKKVQISIDVATLELLDSIVERVPDIESRSAAIRWNARKIDEILKAEQDKKEGKP